MTDYRSLEAQWNVNRLNERHNRRNNTPEQAAKRERVLAEIAALEAENEAARVRRENARAEADRLFEEQMAAFYAARG